MAIIYRKGDLVQKFLDGEVDCLIHQTNCQGVMGSGIAKQIKEKIPAAYEAYKVKEFYEGLILGDFSYADAIIQDRTSTLTEVRGLVINVNGQDNYANRELCNTNYGALGKGLFDSKKIIPKSFIIGLPKIGAGLGGGDWNVIASIIESVFSDRDVYVYVLD